MNLIIHTPETLLMEAWRAYDGLKGTWTTRRQQEISDPGSVRRQVLLNIIQELDLRERNEAAKFYNASRIHDWFVDQHLWDLTLHPPGQLTVHASPFQGYIWPLTWRKSEDATLDMDEKYMIKFPYEPLWVETVIRAVKHQQLQPTYVDVQPSFPRQLPAPAAAVAPRSSDVPTQSLNTPMHWHWTGAGSGVGAGAGSYAEQPPSVSQGKRRRT